MMREGFIISSVHTEWQLVGFQPKCSTRPKNMSHANLEEATNESSFTEEVRTTLDLHPTQPSFPYGSTRTSSVKMESNNMSGISKILKIQQDEVKCRQNLHSPCFSRASPSSKLAACADPSTKAAELSQREEKYWKPPHQLPADQRSRLTNLIFHRSENNKFHLFLLLISSNVTNYTSHVKRKLSNLHAVFPFIEILANICSLNKPFACILTASAQMFQKQMQQRHVVKKNIVL